MAGSSFGKAFHITTFGESHGPGIGVVIQGCPPGLPMDESLIQKALNRRKPGQGVGGTKRREPDNPVILSGVFQGQTTGTPLAILIQNKDARSSAYSDIAHLYRPGHGDFTYQKNTESGISGAGAGHRPGKPQPGWRPVQWHKRFWTVMA